MSLPLHDTEAEGASNREFVAARVDGIFVLLDHLGVLQFSGEDAETFLQGQLSCDVAGVSLRSSAYGAYCSPKGRMLANFLLWRGEAGFFMALSRDILPVVQKHISKFVLRSKVKVSDASDGVVLAGVSGPHADRILQSAFPDFPAKPDEVRHAPGTGTVLRLRDGRLVLALAASAAPALLRQIEGSIKRANAGIWRWLEIRQGLPLVTASTQDQLIPQMVNLELIGGVSFDKGCYPGQEVVARTQHRGKVKRRMFLANVAAPAAAGDALYSDDFGDQASGMVVNSEASPDGGHDLLAVVQTASREGSTVHLKSLAGPALRFLALPYAVA
ncbi:MAG TPA: folate-binding protein [Burkholderiales bacterium]|nr:folate-binding protein [Burkholderiales bacterium]